MTRKRFVKLLMAKGYSRNEANRAAEFAYMLKPSYKAAYIELNTGVLDLSRIDTKTLHEAMERVIDSVLRIAEAFVAGMRAFTDAVNAEMAKGRTD